MLLIRHGRSTDAREAIKTLRRSILELYGADHKDDPAELDAWLANKTQAAWRNWVLRGDTVLLVVQRDRKIVGVGMATWSGEILLNYVHPDVRFCGISKAILAALEAVLRSSNIKHCSLESTITAQKFYESCGFRRELGGTLSFSKSL